MTTLNELIIRELKSNLQHEPTPQEVLSVAQYLAEKINEKSKFIDYEYSIMIWEKEKIVKCSWCEEKYLPEEMEYNADCGEHFCCEQCKKDWETEHGKAL